jgi:hypothetical protein
MSLDIFFGTSPIKITDYKLINYNISTSSAWRLYSMVDYWRNTPSFKIDERIKKVKDEDVENYIISRGKILSIAVESFGLAKNAKYNTYIDEVFNKILNEYTIKIDYKEFRGATLAGEIRELCGNYIIGIPRKKDIENLIQKDCLPFKLINRGYTTWAGHANSGFFYNRNEIYPLLGFSTIKFYNDFKNTDNNCENIFNNGLCDKTVLTAALNHIQENQYSFSHVMTIDTHFPIYKNRGELMECDKNSSLENSMCIYESRMREALNSIVELIKEHPAKPDFIFIYGDHAPPYISDEMRNQFDNKNIPIIKLFKK